jgi:hypothetical protein
VVVGKLKISSQADAVRHLFMALEKKAKKIKLCWLCRSPLSPLKLANQGHLSGNHKPNCPFEELAGIAEDCIKARLDEQRARENAGRLSEKIDALLAANAQFCPCPICECPLDLEHNYGCPFRTLSEFRGTPGNHSQIQT